MNAKLTKLIAETTPKIIRASREPMLGNNATAAVSQLLTEFAIAMDEAPPAPPINPPVN